MSRSRKKLILEFTEFNLQRFNSDSVQVATHVDNPQLSTNAFDKHQDAIRQAMSRIDDILYNLKGTTAYSTLRSKLSLDDQDIQKIKIQRIINSNNVNYDVYLTLTIDDKEYWGKIFDIMGHNVEFKSEVFNDLDLYQSKEWQIKTKGIVIKTIKSWLKPESGKYRLLKDEAICYSSNTGKQLVITKDLEIDLVRAYDDNIVIKYDNDYYVLVKDNYIYFNWWFEKIE